MLIALYSARTSGKTTTAALLCQALADRRAPNTLYTDRIIGYDTDRSEQWYGWWTVSREEDGYTPFPYDVVSCATKYFATTTLAKHPHAGKIGIVDLGHLEEHAAIARSVLPIVDHAIMIHPPFMSETERMEGNRTAEFLDMINRERAADGRPELPRLGLFVKEKTQARGQDVKQSRAYWAQEGWEFLSTSIPDSLLAARMNADAPPTGELARRCRVDELVTELETRGVLPGGR